MNCNHIFHLEDLLSETEKVASKQSIRSGNTGKTTQYWKVLETPPWSPQPTVRAYLITQKYLLQINYGSLAKTAVEINLLNNLYSSSEFYATWSFSPGSFRHVHLGWNRSCMLRTKRDWLNSVTCAKQELIYGHHDFIKDHRSMMCYDFLRHSSGKLLEAGFISPIPCLLNSFIWLQNKSHLFHCLLNISGTYESS